MVGKTTEHLLAGTILRVFALIFMLIDGGHLWGWKVCCFPRGARASAGGADKAGWNTPTSLVRVQMLVAAGNGIGFFAFLGSFVLVVGAMLTVRSPYAARWSSLTWCRH